MIHYETRANGSITVKEFSVVSIWDIIDEMKENSSTKAKETILKQNENNLLWKKVLQYAYDPAINFGIVNLDEECFERHHKYNAEPHGDGMMFDILDRLAKREITGNKAKDEIRNFCLNCRDDLQDLLQLILWRDLDIGSSIKTFNKIYGEDFIYQFQTMAARGKDLEYPCYGEVKFNGQRLIIEKEKGNISFKSRNGKEYHPPYLHSQMEFLLGDIDDIALDCEIDGIPSEYGETSLYNSDAVRTAVNGHINKFIRGTAEDGLDMKFRVNVFDMLTIDEFRGKVASVNLEERYDRLDNLFDGIEMRNIRREKPYFIKDWITAKKFYTVIVTNKGEGAMFKLIGRPYQLGDSKHWVKSKVEVDIELEIVGFYQGSKNGKRADTIGGVTVKTSCGRLVVNVGSGLKDIDIDYILENQDDLIGRIINVRINTVTEDKTRDTYSCFLPRFFGGNNTTGNIEAGLRDDKDVANTLEEVYQAEADAQRMLFDK